MTQLLGAHCWGCTRRYHFASIQPAAFTDITEGDNNCTMGHCCTYGYPATEGWDPLTGLGTPRFDLLVEYVKGLP